MNAKKQSRMEKYVISAVNVSILLLIFAAIVPYVQSLPSAPIITYVTNTTYTSSVVNRSVDAKGTITTVTLSSTQQDYKWKAYVGNASGRLALADANGFAIYDWAAGTITGEVYVSRFSTINFNNISCATQGSVDAEQTAAGMSSSSPDSLNATFNFTTHTPFTVGSTPISGCRSTATYRNGTLQNMASAIHQEVLVRDGATSNLVYATLINASTQGYNNQLYDFQMIVAENESATIPFTYFFWVELG